MYYSKERGRGRGNLKLNKKNVFYFEFFLP